MKYKYINSIIRHFLIWTFAFGFWAVMRQFGQELVDGPKFHSFWQQLRVYVALGLMAGVLFGSFEYFFAKRIFRRISFGKAILVGAISYLIIITMLVILGLSIFSMVNENVLSKSLVQNFVFSKEMMLLIFYCFIVTFIVDFINQIDQKFGPGNLWKMLKGEFYNPKEVERIFMFLDLKSSTTIAERIGHIQYSKLIQDCFHDLGVVRKYHAEIYQYVGDEAVLTWEKKIGLSNSNCLKAFFEFKQRLFEKSGYYQKQYQLIPEFKAGLNIGKIVVAEVGQIKREIAYHGDTINTAARIQGECNNLGKDLLISEDLNVNLGQNENFNIVLIGDILLKGKTNKVNIYGVERL